VVKPSPALIARTKLAGVDTINTFIEKKWLPEVGKEIVRRVGGSYKVVFKQGFVVSVTTGNSDMVEVIGIRINSYRNQVTLHHVLGSENDVVDSKALPEILGLTASKIADWAVDETNGRAQTDLPFAAPEVRKRNMERARKIVKDERKDLPYRQRQKREKEVFEELQAGRRT
jgi:hypothetical protein